MDHKNPVARIGAPDIIRQHGVGGELLLLVGGDGEKSRFLFHHQEMVVLKQDRHSLKNLLLEGFGPGNRDLLPW
ncbi:hypothetical protein D3C81_2002370 [compost metagenome]